MPLPTEQELTILTTRLEEALGPDVRVGVAPLNEDEYDGADDLFPEEAAAVAKAIPGGCRSTQPDAAWPASSSNHWAFPSSRCHPSPTAVRNGRWARWAPLPTLAVCASSSLPEAV